MSYLGRLSSRTMLASPSAIAEPALRSTLRSQSPIAEIDQRLGLVDHAFDHVPWPVGQESAEAPHAEIPAPTKRAPPSSVNPTFHTLPARSTAEHESLQPPIEPVPRARMAESPASARAATESLSEVGKSSQQSTEQPAKILSERHIAVSHQPSSRAGRKQEDTNVMPEAAELPSLSMAEPRSRSQPTVPEPTASERPQSATGPVVPSGESTTQVEASSGKSSAATLTPNQIRRPTAPAVAVTPASDATIDTRTPNVEIKPVPATHNVAEGEKAVPWLKPNAQSAAAAALGTDPLGGPQEYASPRLIIDQLTVEVIPPAATENPHRNQPKPDAKQAQNQARAPLSLIGPLGNSVSAQVRFGLRHR